MKVFGWSLAVALAVVGIAVVAVLGGMGRETAANWMLGAIVVGGLVMAWRFGPALMRPNPPKGGPVDLDSAPDRGDT
jgi:hypothetical protein